MLAAETHLHKGAVHERVEPAVHRHDCRADPLRVLRSADVPRRPSCRGTSHLRAKKSPVIHALVVLGVVRIGEGFADDQRFRTAIGDVLDPHTTSTEEDSLRLLDIFIPVGGLSLQHRILGLAVSGGCRARVVGRNHGPGHAAVADGRPVGNAGVGLARG